MRFFVDIKKYRKYILYSIKATLKSEVAASHLSYLWWILEPVCFMFIYIFIAEVVFSAREPYFALFVFVGLTIWQFFNRIILKSVKLIISNKNIVTKIYIPKFILVIINMGVNTVKMSVSIMLIAILMLIYQVPLSKYIFYIIPLLILLMIVTFGISCLLMHCGVFIADLQNAITIGIRLVFYMSGIFYMISSRVPDPYDIIILKINPLAMLIDSIRRTLIYSQNPDYMGMGLWFISGLAISILSVYLIYRYENTYVKVMK